MYVYDIVTLFAFSVHAKLLHAQTLLKSLHRKAELFILIKFVYKLHSKNHTKL